MNLFITGEDGRYYGFKLFCDLLTGIVTVDVRDSTFVGWMGKEQQEKHANFAGYLRGDMQARCVEGSLIGDEFWVEGRRVQ